MPLAGYTVLLTSFAIISVPTRVRSAAQASASKSNISFACCSKSSGTPAGLAGTARSSPTFLPRELDAALDLAHVLEMALEPGAVVAGQRAAERARVVEHRVEQARGLRAPPRALLGRRAVAEQALEHDLRIDLHRQRSGRRAPGDRVAVGAGQARAAAQAPFLERQLERRQRRVLAEALRRDLIDGRCRAAASRRSRAVRRSARRPTSACGSRRPRRPRRTRAATSGR